MRERGVRLRVLQSQSWATSGKYVSHLYAGHLQTGHINLALDILYRDITALINKQPTSLNGAFTDHSDYMTHLGVDPGPQYLSTI